MTSGVIRNIKVVAKDNRFSRIFISQFRLRMTAAELFLHNFFYSTLVDSLFTSTKIKKNVSHCPNKVKKNQGNDNKASQRYTYR